MSCSRAASSSRSARVDAAHQPAREHDGLDEVPVDGVAVDRAALRARAHGRPLGQPAVDDAGLVQALPDADQAGTGGQQVGEQVARDRAATARAGSGACPARLASVVGAMGRLARAATTAARSGSSGSVDRRAARPEDDLAVVLEHAEAERVELRAARADPQGAGPLGLAGPADRAVEGVGDGAAGVGDRGQQLVGVGRGRAARRRRRGPRGSSRSRPRPVTTCTASRTSSSVGAPRRPRRAAGR